MNHDEIIEKYMNDLYIATKCNWSYESQGSWGGDSEVDNKLGPTIATMIIQVPDTQVENMGKNFVKSQYVEVRQKNGFDMTIHCNSYSWKWNEFHQFVQEMQEISK